MEGGGNVSIDKKSISPSRSVHFDKSNAGGSMNRKNTQPMVNVD